MSNALSSGLNNRRIGMNFNGKIKLWSKPKLNGYSVIWGRIRRDILRRKAVSQVNVPLLGTYYVYDTGLSTWGKKSKTILSLEKLSTI